MVINFDKSKYSSDLIISLISKAENMKYFNENIQ